MEDTTLFQDGVRNLKIQIRHEGEYVKDGLSVTQGRRLHICCQRTLPDGRVIRFRIAFPKNNPLLMDDWSASELIYDPSKTTIDPVSGV